VLRISKRHEPVNIIHCSSCIWNEPFSYSRRYRPTPEKHLEGQPRVCGRTQNTDKEFSRIMIQKFEMAMMGELKYFLGFQVKQLQEGTFISQTKYIQDILT
jgi:hypothetical protein